jgi:hypothetical protein
VAHHDAPFLVRKRARFEENGVWNAYLADVMEEGASVQFLKGPAFKPKGGSETGSQLGHPERMSFRLMVAQVEGMREDLDARVIGLDEFFLRRLELAIELGVPDGGGRLASKGLGNAYLLLVIVLVVSADKEDGSKGARGAKEGKY